MACVVDVNARQRKVTELLTAEGSAPIEIHIRLRRVHGKDAVEISSDAGSDVLIAVKRTLVTAPQPSTSHGNDDGDKRQVSWADSA